MHKNLSICAGKLTWSCCVVPNDRKVKMHNLWEYTSTRKSLLSKRIYLLMSACQENFSESNKKAAGETRGNLNHLFMK